MTKNDIWFMTIALGFLLAMYLISALTYEPPRYDANTYSHVLSVCFTEATRLSDTQELDYREVLKECQTLAQEAARQ